AEISEPKVDEIGNPCLLRTLPADLEHARRGVDADHANAVRGDRHRDPTGADAELDHGRRHASRLGHIEPNVLGDAQPPGAVEARDRVVGVHAVMLSIVKASAQTLFTGPRCGTGSLALAA